MVPAEGYGKIVGEENINSITKAEKSMPFQELSRKPSTYQIFIEQMILSKQATIHNVLFIIIIAKM